MRHQPPDPAASPALRVADLVREAPPVGAARVVGIDGRSGAGKTDLADEVHTATGWPVAHAEDVYPGWDGLAKAPALLAEHLLRPLSRGQDAELPTWDWRAGRPGPVRLLPFAPVVVLEGCAATAEPARELLCVTVWLSAPEAVRRRRALGRDGETFAPHWERWARQERSVLSGLEERADLVLAT